MADIAVKDLSTVAPGTGDKALIADASNAGEASLVDIDAIAARATSNGAAAASALTAHTGNTSNPHATTAAQVGAYSAAQTDTLLSGKANTAHTHTLSQVTDAGSAAALNAPASGNAAAGEAVKGSDTRLSDARPPTAHTHPASDIASGTIATGRLGSGTPDATKFLRGDQTWATPSGGASETRIVLRTNDYTPSATPPASGVAAIGDDNAAQAITDLSAFTEAKLLFGSSWQSGGAAPYMAVQYRVAGGSWLYLDGVSGPAASMAGGGYSAVQSSGWVTIASAARALVQLRLVTRGGDGSTAYNYNAPVLLVR